MRPLKLSLRKLSCGEVEPELTQKLSNSILNLLYGLGLSSNDVCTSIRDLSCPTSSSNSAVVDPAGTAATSEETGEKKGPSKSELKKREKEAEKERKRIEREAKEAAAKAAREAADVVSLAC